MDLIVDAREESPESQVTRSFAETVDRLQLPPLHWAMWHLAQLRDLAADPLTAREMEETLVEDAELRDEVTALLDRLGEVAADARLRAAPEG